MRLAHIICIVVVAIIVALAILLVLIDVSQHLVSRLEVREL